MNWTYHLHLLPRDLQPLERERLAQQFSVFLRRPNEAIDNDDQMIYQKLVVLEDTFLPCSEQTAKFKFETV